MADPRFNIPDEELERTPISKPDNSDRNRDTDDLNKLSDEERALYGNLTKRGELNDEDKASLEELEKKIKGEKQDPPKDDFEKDDKKDDDSEEEEENEDEELTEEELSQLEEDIRLIEEKEEDELTDEDKEKLDQYRDLTMTEVQRIHESNGYDKYESIDPTKYDDDLDGLTKYYNDIAEEKAKEKFEETLKKNPVMDAFYKHVNNGGSIESFQAANRENPYTTIEINKETDDATLESIVRADLKDQGLSDKRINLLVNSFKEDKSLADEAKSSQKSIVEREEANAQQILQEEQEANIRKQEEQAKINKRAKEIINSNNFDGLKIPEADLNEFKNNLLKTGKDENGNPISQVDKKWSELSLEKQLFIDYLVSKDFKIKGLNFNNVSQKKSLKEMKKANNNRKNLLRDRRGSDSTKDKTQRSDNNDLGTMIANSLK